MAAELMNFDLPRNKSSIIKVIGVGGGGGNAVNHMFKQGITDVDFVICNTDAQALVSSAIPLKIQLGETLTQGRGAGNKPEQGRQAAIESLEHISEVLQHNTKMVFITAGMGGGTGTGAAPIIAKEAKDLGILTVGIVTLPFRFEGKRRIQQAVDGLNEMRQHVDALLVINNEKLREIYGDLPLSQAFGRADNVLTVAAKGIAEIITVHGSVNVDFADVQTVMTNSGVALMGSAMATGPDRAMQAIEEALNSPLLNNNDIKGAKNILLNISSGPDDEVRMDEIGQITDYVQQAAGLNADIIWGNNLDQNLGDKICVTIIATGFDTDSIPEIAANQSNEVITVPLQIEKPVATKPTPVVADKNTDKITFEVIDRSELPKTADKPIANPVVTPISDTEIERFELFAEPKPKTTKPVQLDLGIASVAEHQQQKVARVERPQMSYNNDSDIDALESQPAYLRKNIVLDDMNEIPVNKEVSRFTLVDSDGVTRISDNNAFLNAKVD